MATTTNFGWETPDDTDLVKDGALAIRTLGNSIDTSLVDLKGGTTGQVLSKTSNTDMDFTWVAQDDSNAIQNAIVDAKGDLISATAADTPSRLAVGTNGQVLTADSTTATGLKWATAASGALTKITTTAFTGATSVSVNNCFTSTYRNYLIVIDDLNSGSNASDVYIQWQYSTNTVQATSYYSGAYYMGANGTSGNYNRSNSTSITLGQFTNLGRGIVHINVCNVGQSSEDALWSGISNGVNSNGVAIFGGSMDAAQTYTGFKISAANNIVGNVTVYGLEK